MIDIVIKKYVARISTVILTGDCVFSFLGKEF